MRLNADVVVVGGSVAGSATALHLSRRGYSVVVIDRVAFPRDKVCGEGLLPHGVEELVRLGLMDAVRATRPVPFDGITYVKGDLVATGRFPAGFGLGVRRLRFDAMLREAAMASPGVLLRTGAVRRVRVLTNGVRVSVDGDDLTARALVGADGRASSVRRWSGLETSAPGRHRYGLRVHLRLPASRENLRRVEVHLTDRAEVYLTPVAPDELNVALLLEKSVTRDLKSLTTEGALCLIRSCAGLAPVVDGAEPISEAALVGPLRQTVRRRVAPRTVLVGDAAGFVDAITGEGMSIALVSARLAAETLDAALASDDLSERALSPYNAEYRRHVADPSRLTRWMVWGVRHPALAHRVVRGLSRNPALFDRILAVNCGQATLASIVPSAWRLFC